MGLADNLNFLTTIGTFGCISFALSGFGVKLGKFSSYPHQLGFSYISDNEDKEKQTKLYEAIAKISTEDAKKDSTVPTWAKSKEGLENWCKVNQKSPMKWEEASRYCLVRRNVWHQLILNGVNLKQEILKSDSQDPKPAVPEAPQIEGSSQAKVEEKCTYKLLNMYADSENHVDYLIGKRACAEETKAPATSPAPVQAAESNSGGSASSGTAENTSV